MQRTGTHLGGRVGDPHVQDIVFRMALSHLQQLPEGKVKLHRRCSRRQQDEHEKREESMRLSTL